MSLESERRVMFPGFYKTVAEIKEGAQPTSTGDAHLDALLWSARMGFSNRQLIISFTKWMHGFNVTDVDVDFTLLQGELEEAVDAYKNGTIGDTAFELADIAIYCYGIAQMLGVDLEEYINRKMQINIERSYDK